MDQHGLIHTPSESTVSRAAGYEGGNVIKSQAHRRIKTLIFFSTIGRVKIPRIHFLRKATEVIIELTLRALSVRPTAPATERTFSL